MSLDAVALAEAREAYLAALREGAGPSDVVRRVVEAYRAVRPPEAPSRLSSGVRRMMAMAMGEEHLLKDVSAPTAQRYAYSARRQLRNPQARWSVRTVDGGVAVRRLPDGPMRDPRRNALAAEMAELAVGQKVMSRVRKTPVPGSVGAAAIAAARKILGEPRADWTFRTGKTGIWITRITPGQIKQGRRVTAAGELPGKAVWILEKTAHKHRVSPAVVRSKTRRAPVVRARHEAWLEMAQVRRANGSTLWPLRAIAEWFGTDHATVIAALRKLGYRRSGKEDSLTEAA